MCCIVKTIGANCTREGRVGHVAPSGLFFRDHKSPQLALGATRFVPVGAEEVGGAHPTIGGGKLAVFALLCAVLAHHFIQHAIDGDVEFFFGFVAAGFDLGFDDVNLAHPHFVGAQGGQEVRMARELEAIGGPWHG